VDITLTETECRVLGSLIEKELTTPEYYPLSLNGLMLACNQKSNRNPMMDMSQDMVSVAVEGLRNKHLAWERREAGARVLKYEHNLPGLAQFSIAESAILCELLVRGPQTPGELRNRASRMNAFKDIFEVEETLKLLSTRAEGPFVTQLPRAKGTKETRYGHLFLGQPAGASSSQSTGTEQPAIQEPIPATASQPSIPAASPQPSIQELMPVSAPELATMEKSTEPIGNSRIDELEVEVNILKEDMEALKKQIEELKAKVG
jgi:uncharacterized protein